VLLQHAFRETRKSPPTLPRPRLVDGGVVGGVPLRADGEDAAEGVHCHPDEILVHLTASARAALVVKPVLVSR